MDFKVFWTYAVVFLHGFLVFGSDVVSVSVIEGDPVTLHNNIKIATDDRIQWYFKSTRIAQIAVYSSQTCTDVQCNEGTERFRDRLKLEHQTGSLTIINTTITDAGEYTLRITMIGSGDEKIFIVNVTIYDVSFADKPEQGKDAEEQTDSSNPGWSVGEKIGIGFGVAFALLPVCIAVGLYKFRRQCKRIYLRYSRARVQDPPNHEMMNVGEV